MEASIFEPMTEPMRRVLDALAEGVPAPPDAQAALTEAERAEIASLARTTHLAHLTLQQPAPPNEAEQASLGRAQAALENRPAPVGPKEGPEPPRKRAGWLGRFFRRGDK